MKATLTYTLPDELEKYEMAMNGIKYSCATSDFEQVLRTAYKHGYIGESEVVKMSGEEVLEALRERFFDCFSEINRG